MQKRNIIIPALIMSSVLIITLATAGMLFTKTLPLSDVLTWDTLRTLLLKNFEHSTPETSEESAVIGAPKTIKLGFNNAEQFIETADGSLAVWISHETLFLAVRDTEGRAISTVPLATGALRYPAIAQTDSAIAVGWIAGSGKLTEVFMTTSSDGGRTFTDAQSLGRGNGISLSANDSEFFAVWHVEENGSAGSIQFSSYNGTWRTPMRIDASTAAPKWASVDAHGENIFATWRDNREGNYSVWLRQSADGGKTWLEEQHIATEKSGDPDVCVAENGTVWIGYHEKGDIRLLRAENSNTSFEPAVHVGDGSFAHVSCTNRGVAISWEMTPNGGAMTANKLAGWAAYDTQSTLLASGTFGEPTSAAATAFLSSDSNSLEILWIHVTDQNDPLTGTLMHSYVQIPW